MSEVSTAKLRERAEWSLEHGHGGFSADEVLDLVAENERFRWGLQQIAKGRWNTKGGIKKSGRRFAGDVLRGVAAPSEGVTG